MTAEQVSVRAKQALELRRAGVPVVDIRKQLKFRDDRATEDAIAGAMTVQGDLNEMRLLELDRLDRMLFGVWSKATKGDVAAIDRVLKISAERRSWAGTPKEQLVLTAAYDAAIEQLHLKAVDGAAVAAGRAIAEQVDIARATGDPLRVQKAMYLMPHLMGVLDKLGATPAARDEINAAAPGAPLPKKAAAETDFERFTRERAESAARTAG